MDPIQILLILLILFGAAFTVVFFMDVMKHKDEKVLGEGGQEIKGNLIINACIGAVTNFFDTVGIGSFAPTTFLFKTTKTVDIGVVPGTLNVAHTIPVVFMAWLYIGYVEIDALTLYLLIGSSVIGAWLGAGIVAKFNRRTIVGVVGASLIVVALIMFLRTPASGLLIGLEGSTFMSGPGIVRWNTAEAATLGLTGVRLVIGVIGFFILGALMTAGVGLYSPAMALVFMLGLAQPAAFPIMMGACAFLMSVAGIKFVREGKYARKQSLAIALAGLPGVWLAFNFFRHLSGNINQLIYVVVTVVTITGIMMLMEYFKTGKSA
ncbi:MAG: sulfite exporter TauE/SafE family protein [Turicibacter sp.]|nr:sulfite exporter TauE/SafE family protein [Turicibacter sp.]